MDGQRAGTSADLDDIRAIAMDYAEGWYTANADRMARACHDSLVKRTLVRSGDGQRWTSGPISTKAAMVTWTAEGGGRELGTGLEYQIEVLDVFRDIATVRCVSAEYVDYLQLARFGDAGWQVLNVLWQLKEGEFKPTAS